MSKYSDPLAEAAEAIVNDGMADAECGTVEFGGEHYALVTLTYDALNDDVAARVEGLARSAPPTLFDGSRVIIRTDTQGFVDTFYGPAHPLGDPAAYRALMAAWEELVTENLAEDESENARANEPDGLRDLRASTSDATLPAYAWPGGYQMHYLTADGLTVCPKCANDPDTSDPVVAGDIYYEGPPIVCDDGSQCGAMVDGTWRAGMIESAYGDPEALTDDECTAIGADGRDGRGEITESNLTDAERASLAAYRADR